jgi:hypothetical protein
VALAGHASEPAVGQVTLLIGEAHVVRKGGDAETLRRGTEIRVGDRIETAANGHVHVRFVDNAAVSVRPQSVLEVVTYQYDSDRPQASEVRLQLDQGAGRSISGRATSVDKNRFRLNTPLAAIGVRGTDFIVQSSDAAVRATVAEGSIVVGALGAGCSAAALGPCAGGQNTVLSAEMGRRSTMQRGDRVARVARPPNAAAAVAPPVGRRVAAQWQPNGRAHGGLQAAEPTGATTAAADALTIAAATLPNLNSRSNPNAQLAWGRYSVAPAFNDGVSVPYARVSADLYRQFRLHAVPQRRRQPAAHRAGQQRSQCHLQAQSSPGHLRHRFSGRGGHGRWWHADAGLRPPKLCHRPGAVVADRRAGRTARGR